MNDFENVVDNLYPTWHAQALCNGKDPEIWFPETPRHRDFTRADAAKQAQTICARCPVIEQCNSDRIRHGETHGIWAGIDLDAKKEENNDAA